MSITVNTNMSSIIAQRSLYKATNKMNTALERLSTGLRINSSKDDAAGSAISTKLEYKMSSYNVAKDNAQMGQSMLDTANGTLSNINSMLQRMRDLSEQASNGTYGEDERKAMQAEIDGLTEEIYRIKNTTEFNGKKILGEEEPNIQKITETEAIAKGFSVVKTAQEFQDAFYKEKEGGDFDKIDNRFVKVNKGTGHYEQKLDAKVALFADIDLNELGYDESGSNWTKIGGNNTKTWQEQTVVYSGTLEGNGHTISNLTIHKNTTETQGVITEGLFGHTKHAKIKNLTLENVTIDTNEKFVGALIGWANVDTIVENCKVTGTITGFQRLGGIIGNCQRSYIINSEFIGQVKGEDFVGGFVGQLIIGNDIGSQIKNSYCSSIVSGTTSVGAFTGRINSDKCKILNSYCDIEKSRQINTVGSFDEKVTTVEIKDSKNNPFKRPDNSMKTNLQVGINSDANSTITVDTGFSLNDLNISVLNEFSARNSLGKIDAMMSKITDKLTNIGATQNRLESVMEFQEIQRNALTSANSLIKDADIAKESANYVKNQILQNVTSTLLSTANQNPSIALQLI